MQITLDLPEDIAKGLSGSSADLARIALESLAIEGYRSRQLSEEQVRRMLGFDSRWDVHEFLKQHDVYLNYSEADFAEDLAKPIRHV
jgi:hypothetical protein